MSEMVERVAEALDASLSKGCYVDARDDGHDTTVDGACDLFEIARAAIEAMREPTLSMEDAAVPNGSWWDDSCAKVVWRNMIDAALTAAAPSSPD